MLDGYVEIEGFEDYYINKNGVIISLKRRKPHTIKGFYDKDGYRRVSLYNKKGERIHNAVHRLVAYAFIPNPNGYPIINHKNGIKDDNAVSNLEWSTNSLNQKHSFRVLGTKPNITSKEVKLRCKQTGERYQFDSRKECAEYFDMSQEHMGRLLNGRNNWDTSTMRDYKIIK